jgi:hypothetical protein
MDTNRKIAIIVGILFIIATVAGSLSVIVYGSLLKIPVDLTAVATSVNQIVIGSLLYLLMNAAIPAIAIAIYPVLKKYNEAWALGYVVARVGEGFFFCIQVLAVAVVFFLAQGWVKAGSAAVPGLANLMVTAGDWAFHFGFGLFFLTSALILNFVLYRTKLGPRWLSGWGFIGALLIIVHYLLIYFGPGQFDALFFPIAIQEMVFALWLIIKGFDKAAAA